MKTRSTRLPKASLWLQGCGPRWPRQGRGLLSRAPPGDLSPPGTDHSDGGSNGDATETIVG